jgi:hypothetical protein
MKASIKNKILKLESQALKLSLPKTYRIFELTEDGLYFDRKSGEILTPDEYQKIERKFLIEYF